MVRSEAGRTSRAGKRAVGKARRRLLTLRPPLVPEAGFEVFTDRISAGRHSATGGYSGRGSLAALSNRMARTTHSLIGHRYAPGVLRSAITRAAVQAVPGWPLAWLVPDQIGLASTAMVPAFGISSWAACEQYCSLLLPNRARNLTLAATVEPL